MARHGKLVRTSHLYHPPNYSLRCEIFRLQIPGPGPPVLSHLFSYSEPLVRYATYPSHPSTLHWLAPPTSSSPSFNLAPETSGEKKKGGGAVGFL